MAQRPMVPTLGAVEGTGLLGPETDRALQQVLSSASGVLEARKAREVLKGLTGLDSESFSGIGNLMEGVGSTFRAVAETQTKLMDTLMNWLKDNKSDGKSGEILTALLAIIQQNTQLIIGMMQEHAKQSEERWKALLEMIREEAERDRQRLEREIEQLRSSASPVEAAVQGQILPSLVQKLVDQWNADPLSQLGQLAKRVQELRAVGSLLGGGSDEYTEGRLKWEELQIQKTRILREHEARMEEVRARREMWQNLPKAAQAAAEGVLKVLGGLGFVPVNTIPPEAEAAARAYLDGQPAAAGA